jgi:hypothetical protein
MGGRPSSTFGDPFDSTESFDPTNGVWTTVDLMNERRERFASVLLDTNKVLAVGGSGFATAELYDPAVSNPPAGNPSPASIPVITSATPATGLVGTTFVASISGTNLAGATAVTFNGAGVSASIGPGATATTLPIVVTIATNAEPGPRTISIRTATETSSPFSGFVILQARNPRPIAAPLSITEVEQGIVQTGYVVITPDQNTTAPVTTLTFGTVQNAVVQDHAGVAPFGLTTGAVLFVDLLNNASRNLGLAIANPTSITNTITITLKYDDGSNAGGPVTINIGPYKQIAKFIDELLPAGFLGQSFVGSINMQSGTPFAVLGFPFAGASFSAQEVGNIGTLSVVPIRALTAGAVADSPRAGTIGGSNAIVLPQFVLGGGWATKIALVNSSSSSATGRIDILDTNGQPLVVKLNGANQSTFVYAMPAGGTFVVAPRDLNGQSPL